MEASVLQLLAEAGIRVQPTARNYRPSVSLPLAEAKTMKPQNIVEMLALGRRDVGFAGADWVEEMDADLVELLDTGLDPVKGCRRGAESLVENGELPRDRSW
jgi:ATP phosphoribosyltransferase